MSKFIDKLNRVRRAEPQPLGFKTAQSVSTRPRIQLVASLAQENVDHLSGYVTGADAGLLRISKPASGIKTMQNLSQTVPDIPWGGWLQDSGPEEVNQIVEAGSDFLVFPATSTP